MAKWMTGAVAAVIVAAAGASTADAARGLRQKEQRAIAIELAVRTACVTGRVSTVNRRWAVVGIRQREGCPVGNGFFIFKRKRGGGWRSRGSNGGYDRNSPVCPQPYPERVAKDLGLCSADA